METTEVVLYRCTMFLNSSYAIKGSFAIRKRILPNFQWKQLQRIACSGGKGIPENVGTKSTKAPPPQVKVVHIGHSVGFLSLSFSTETYKMKKKKKTIEDNEFLLMGY